MNIELKQMPVLVMRPISTVVAETESVDINCHIRNVEEAYFDSNDTMLKLCFANGTEIHRFTGDMYNQSYRFDGRFSENFTCGLGNCTQFGVSSRITVTGKETTLCPSVNIWPSTLSEHDATAPCPSGYTGTQKRTCGKDGKWGEINADTCKQEKLEKLENALNISPNISESMVESSLSTISDIVNQTSSPGEKGMASVDIVQSVNLIAKISQKNITFTDQKAAEKTAETFMGVVSNLLGTGKDHVTTKNKTQGKEVTGQILSSVDGFAKSVTKALTVNQSVTVKRDNLLLNIERIPKQKIVFPKETENAVDDGTKFTLPEDALGDITDVAFTAVKYDNFGSELDTAGSSRNSSLGSSVLSLTLENVKEIMKNISLTFEQNSRNASVNTTSECVFLNKPEHSWNNTGCSVLHSNSSYTTCTCSHLTSFAILMSVDFGEDNKTPPPDDERLTMISNIGCSCSIVGSLATIFIYLYFWRYMKSRRSVLIINLCLAMFIAYMLFLSAKDRTENHIGCVVIAALLHYFFLAMFCIMLALGIDLTVAVLDVFNSRSSSAFLLLLGWGLPAVIVAITLGVTETRGFGNKKVCWLARTTRYGFIVPALVIILINFAILAVAMRALFSSSFMIKKSIRDKARSGIRGTCALLPVLGLTWVFGILYIDENTIIFGYLFAVFNSLQGLFIFLFHVLLNNQVRKAISRKIQKYESRSLTTKSSKYKSESKSNSKDLHSEDEVKESQNNSGVFLLPRINVSNPVRRTTYTSF
ncbi:adhesion G protein-coupled receptor L3-like [Ostrea edulis]|uniref:adhesion G protein-coupled receptor L3-like n=1 Tax=Ostrea edulis TaxID=37623 RepID=UPI0024AF0692|nr:adhesion G protein-coupled receptor L3-like [Ostrea edulis]